MSRKAIRGRYAAIVKNLSSADPTAGLTHVENALARAFHITARTYELIDPSQPDGRDAEARRARPGYTKLDLADHVFFVGSALCKSTEALLKQAFNEQPELKDRVSDLFIQAIEYLVLVLRRGGSPLAQVIGFLVDIFDEEWSFYVGDHPLDYRPPDSSSSDDDGSSSYWDPNDGASGRYAVATNSTVSGWLIRHINAFGEAGGFTELLGLLERSSSSSSSSSSTSDSEVVPVAVVETALQAVASVRHHLNIDETDGVEWYGQWIDGTTAAFMAYILNASEEQFKTFDREQLSRSLGHLRKLNRLVHSQRHVDQLIEEFQLRVVLKGLGFVALGQRLNALGLLTSLVQRVMQREWPDATGDGTAANKSVYLTSAQLAAWLEANRVLEQLFAGCGVHDQLMQRCGDVFKLLARGGSLRLGHIDLLWDATVATHDATVATIYELLRQIAPYLGHQHFAYLFEAKICRMSAADFDAQSLQLLKSLCFYASCVSVPAEGQALPAAAGLLCLWRLATASSDGGKQKNGDARQRALDVLIELFSKYESLRHYRLQFIERCVANIKAGAAVRESLQLLHELIKSYGDQKTQIIVEVERSSGLLGLLLAQLEPASSAARLSLDELQLRLAFFLFLADSSTVLTDSHVDTIFAFACAAGGAELVACLDFFKSVAELRTAANHLRNVAAYIFEAKLCSPAFVARPFPLAGFACWQSYFQLINSLHKRLLLTDAPPRDCLLLDTQLSGIDTLWTIALTAADDAVCRCASVYLRRLYCVLPPRLYRAAAAVRRQFVQTAMSRLTDYQQAGQAVYVLRCLDLLRRFVEHFERCLCRLRDASSLIRIVVQRRHASSSSSSAAAASPTREQATARQKFHLHMFDDDRLLDLRQCLAEQVGVAPLALRLGNLPIARSITADDWSETLASLRFEDGTRIMFDFDPHHQHAVEALAGDACSAEQLYDAATLPGHMIVEHAPFFDALWQLLEHDSGSVSSTAWQLILSLPTSSSWRARLVDLRGPSVDWKDVLGLHSPFRLNYSLRIVLGIIAADQSLPDCNVDDWWHSFIALGGLRELYQCVVQSASGQLSDTSAEVLGRLLRVLSEYMRRASSLADFAAHLGDQFSLLGAVQLLLRTLAELAVHAPADSAANEALVREACSCLFTLLLLGDSPVDFYDALQRPAADYLSVDASNGASLLELLTLHGANRTVRRAFGSCLSSYCNQSRQWLITDDVDGFSRLLPSVLQLIVRLPPVAANCKQLFALFADLLSYIFFDMRDSDDTDDDDDDDDDDIAVLLRAKFAPQLDGMALQLVKRLKRQPLVEGGALLLAAKQPSRDRVLIGLLESLQLLLDIQPALATCMGSASPNSGRRLTRFVFKNCLFDAPAQLCKSAEARRAGIRLLLALVNSNAVNRDTAVQLIQRGVLDANAGHAALQPWQYSPEAERRSELGYTGLVNPACICYMNSLMQQFYMMPQLRAGILSVDLHGRPHDEPLFQMQRMFAFLHGSDRRAYHPRPFAKSFKDFDGKSTNMSVQMDAEEFFNQFVEKINAGLQDTAQAALFKDTWTGVLSNQLIGTGDCEHFREREETFQTLTVGIKGRQNLQEALEQFVEGELLAGDNAFFCDTCQKKIDTLKRVCVKRLPDTVIIHLKRFEFDLDIMRNVKLNDRCEFGMSIDLYPYTSAFLQNRLSPTSATPLRQSQDAAAAAEPGSDLYDLKGILIHKGSADSGHYYSFVNERQPPEHCPADAPLRWIEFNDDVVRTFDIANLAAECFGGTELRTVVEAGQQVRKQVPITHNAYMLFYERRQPLSSSTSSTSSSSSSSTSSTSSIALPEYIANDVRADNRVFTQDRLFFEHEWLRFMCKFIDRLDVAAVGDYPAVLPDINDDSEGDLGRVSFAVQTFLELLCRGSEVRQVRRAAVALKKLFHKNVLAARWYLHALDRHRIERHLLECSFAESRAAFAASVVHAFRSLIAYEEDALAEVDVADSDSDCDEKTAVDEEEAQQQRELLAAQRALRRRSQASTWRFLRAFYRTIAGCQWSWRQWHEYFVLLREIGLLSENVRRYLLLKNREHNATIVNRLLEFYHGQNMFGPSKFLRTKIGDRYTAPNHHSVVSLLCVLASACNTGAPDSEDSPFALEGDKFQLTLSGPLQEHIISAKFVVSALRGRLASEDVARLLVHWAFNSEKRSDRIIDLFHKGIDESSYAQLRGFMEPLAVLLDCPDALQSRRIERSLDFLLRLAVQRWQQADQARYVKTVFEYLLAFRQESAAVASHFDRLLTAEHTAWMNAFLRQNSRTPSGFAELPLMPGYWRMLPTADMAADEAEIWEPCA